MKTRTTGKRELKDYSFDIIDIYEDMLTQRAELGFRPVLYVSTERDFECSLIGLYEREAGQSATGEAVPPTETVDELWRRLR